MRCGESLHVIQELGHALLQDCVGLDEAPSCTPWNWGSTLITVPAESLGQSVGGGPAWACALPRLFDPSPRGRREQWRLFPGRGLGFPTTWPQSPCALFLASAVHTRVAFLSRPGSPDRGREGLGTEASGGPSREVGAVEIGPGAGPPRWGPLPASPQPSAAKHTAGLGLLTFRSS